MGTIVRDSIVPYTTARKAGWNDVDLPRRGRRPTTWSSARRRAWTASTAWASPRCPTSTAGPSVKTFVEAYKKKFNVDPNIGAVYGYVAADLTCQGLKNAGKDLTLDSFVKGLEAIKDYKDIFNGPQVTFGPNIRQGANSSFLAEVKGGTLDARDRAARLLDGAACLNKDEARVATARVSCVIAGGGQPGGGGTVTRASRSFCCSTGMPAA